MLTVPANSIIVLSRQRHVFDKQKLEELADSIASKGLLHPIVCAVSEEGLRLIAGDRRLRAMKMLQATHRVFRCDGKNYHPTDGNVPVILVTDLDQIQLREAELEENLIRVNLSWQERAAALEELHELRLAQNPEQSVLDTAREINADGSQNTRWTAQVVSQSRLVVPYLDHPEVARAGDLKAATGIVSKLLDRELTKALDEQLEKEKNEDGENDDKRQTSSPHLLIHEDFMEVLADYNTYMNTPPFTCIIADPPYGIDADEFGDAANTSHIYEDDREHASQVARGIFQCGFLCTARDAHLYMFCDLSLFPLLREHAIDFGWKPARTPLIWTKSSNQGHAPYGLYGHRRTYECILFATKGDKPFRQIYSDTISFPDLRDKDVAAQKPSGLYELLLSRSCIPGDDVLDPCCGSGTIFLAADRLNLNAVGIEIDPLAYDAANLTLKSIAENETTENEMEQDNGK